MLLALFGHKGIYHDFKLALNQKDQWLFLGWQEIKSRYRRTKLGPIWLVLVNLVTIVCFSVVGSLLFKQNLFDFLPYVACSMFVWTYIASLISESCSVFIVQAPVLQNLIANPINFCIRLFVKNTIVFFHCFPIILLVVALLGDGFSWNFMLFLLAFPIYAMTAFSLSLILGMLTARFRDINHIVQSILSILPFLTPILWKAEMLGNNRIIADINPITHYIALMRDPILFNQVNLTSYGITLCITALLMMIACLVYNRFKHRLVFWL